MTTTPITWTWNHRAGHVCTSNDGRWIITELYAQKWELYDHHDMQIIGTYQFYIEAQKMAGSLSDTGATQ